MAGKTAQEEVKQGRPFAPPRYKKRHRVTAALNDVQKEALIALVQHWVEETTNAPSEQATICWLIIDKAKELKIGPYSENGQ